ncbi:MAG: glycosyltransferase family 4 protein [Candidatus Eremiobacteraeota bacterium]|nr:glycosyltransferase family 4 protein [Candidatus Eremiobacteraeota bacterium]MBV8432898.1 glycosyltransferase family 4 protein [Candidatus Eremiobacteraeota bacterium]
MTRKLVGLDARMTRQMSVGMKSYARELVARLPRVAPELEYASFGGAGNFGWSEQVGLPLQMRRASVDLVHFLSIYVPLIAPAPSVITVHDLIHLRFPRYFKAKVGPYYRTVVRLACARARRVITDDERTVDDLERFLGVKPSKVRVIPLGVDERFFTATEPVSAARPYLLYVGNHRKHKNLETLFNAWSSLPKGDALDLYLTGPDDFGGELQRRSTAERSIVALGDVEDDRLPAYYAGARALVQPALREGFGLPILEAMAAGCPVVACEDAVPRVLEPASLTFAATDASELSAILHDVAADEGLRARFVKSGKRIAQTLTWDRCARATADVYGEVL